MSLKLRSTLFLIRPSHCKRKLTEQKYAFRAHRTNEAYGCRSLSSKTINEAEVQKFTSLSQSWWNTSIAMRALRSMNDLRVPLIRDGLKQTQKLDPSITNGPTPLKGLKILDVGCGGGILCEPLARLGAKVTGVDPVSESIIVARQHADQDMSVKDNVQYLFGLVEDLMETEKGTYDAVVASEVVEHVDNLKDFLGCCVALTKEGGSLFFTTPNKTLPSYLINIIGAERVLRVFPSGMHSWDKLIPPRELQLQLESHGCHVRLVHGMLYNILWDSWLWTRSMALHYALHAVKPITETVSVHHEDDSTTSS